jgi:hypothetical protein
MMSESNELKEWRVEIRREYRVWATDFDEATRKATKVEEDRSQPGKWLSFSMA